MGLTPIPHNTYLKKYLSKNKVLMHNNLICICICIVLKYVNQVRITEDMDNL